MNTPDRRPGVAGRLRTWFVGTRLVRSALAAPSDPLWQGPLSLRMVLGLALLVLSYVLGWPAIAVLGTAAACWRRPAWLLAGPALYVFSWLVFALGLLVLGSKSIKAGRSLGLRLLRWVARKR